MESLGDVLKRIRRLEKDLLAQIVIQKEEGHYVETGHYPGHWTDVSPFPDEEDFKYVVDKEEVWGPDTRTREEARTKLQEIHNNSKWYTARYATGRVFDVDQEQLNEQLTSWLDELKNQIQMKKDDEKTLKAVKDVVGLSRFSSSSDIRELLLHVYNKHEYASARKEAGKGLGYSRLRIWTHNKLFRKRK